MKSYSLTRRLILTVLSVELLLALSSTGATLLYERHEDLETFDVMLRGRADSLLGAVQDAEDAADSVMLSPKLLDLRDEDLYEVRAPGGRVIGHSPEWKETLESDFLSSGRGHNFSLHQQRYRGLLIRGVRQVDPDDANGGISRPVIIYYAAPLRPVLSALARAVRFLLLLNSLLLLLTGIALLFLLRRGMAPLQVLAREAAAISPGSWKFESPQEASAVKELSVLAHALESTIQRLERSFNQQRTFVHDAAHELKTAVTIIKSSLQLLCSKARSIEEYEQGLEYCLLDCERLEDLVQKLLTLARLEQSAAGELALEGQSNVNEIAQDVAIQMGSFACLRGVEIDLALAENVVALLPPEECATLTSNLILNALQHTPAGGRVTLSAAMAGGVTRIEVADTGEGIQPVDLPFIFQRFYRGDRSRARATGGTGLGLAICKAIVDAYGGSIEIHSEPGQGTNVRLALPGAASMPENHVQPIFSDRP